jgi:septal ring factor EnvC (AmiA/AmiB activator)
MSEYHSELTSPFCTAAFMEQFAALNVEPGKQDSAVESIAALKQELAEEKLAREKAQTDAETLTRAVEEMKKTADQLSAYVPFLEAKVKTLSDKIVDLNTELRARELGLERTTATKDDL